MHADVQAAPGGDTRRSRAARSSSARYCKQDVEVERELHGRVPPLSGRRTDAVGAQLPDQPARLSFRPVICRSRASDRAGRGARDRCRACRADWRRRHQSQPSRSVCGGGCSSRAARRRSSTARRSKSYSATMRSRGQCAACWSFGSAGLRRRPRRSTRCLPAPTATIAYVAPSAITAPPPARFAGERFQPQNLKRPTVEDLDAAIAAVATGDYAHVKKLYPQPLAVVGDCIRSMICAAPGHVLIRRRSQRDRKPRAGVAGRRGMETRRLSPFTTGPRIRATSPIARPRARSSACHRAPTRRDRNSATSGKHAI